MTECKELSVSSRSQDWIFTTMVKWFWWDLEPVFNLIRELNPFLYDTLLLLLRYKASTKATYIKDILFISHRYQKLVKLQYFSQTSKKLWIQMPDHQASIVQTKIPSSSSRLNYKTFHNSLLNQSAIIYINYRFPPPTDLPSQSTITAAFITYSV